MLHKISTLLFLILKTIFAGQVTEELYDRIGFNNPHDLTNVSSYQRVHITDVGVELRESVHGGSLITFKEKNPYDDWSFEFTIDNPHFKFPERGGVYLWYTENVPDEGAFNGIDGKFIGMMAGIEFLGNYVQLTLTSNDGNDDLNNELISDISVMRDSINPDRFRNMEVFRVKIIKTWKNFKIEIYDGTRLVYDNLRYTDVSELGNVGKGKHFSMTSTYDRVSLSKSFLLKNVRLTKRTEDDNYDPKKIWSYDPGKEEPRMYDVIDHEDNDVRHLISNLEHFMSYIRHFIGKPTGLTLLNGMGDTHREIIRNGLVINKLIEVMNNSKNEQANNVIGDLVIKFDSTQNRINRMVKNMADLGMMIRRFEKNNKNNSHIVLWIFGLGIGVTLVGMVIKRRSLGLRKDRGE